jgi:hypothetical protein
MNLIERLEQCRKQLDRSVIERLIAQDYDIVEAELRNILEEAQKRIEELENDGA